MSTSSLTQYMMLLSKIKVTLIQGKHMSDFPQNYTKCESDLQDHDKSHVASV